MKFIFISMHDSYKKWLDDGCPKIICNCGCSGEIIIKSRQKYYGLPKYISGHSNLINKDIPIWIIKNINKHLCQCGCNQFIKILKQHYYSGIPKYIHGHNPSNSIWKKGNIPWNKGLTQEIDIRVKQNVENLIKYQKTQIGIPKYNAGSIKKGQHLSPETEFTTEKLLGHETSEETRKKLSEWQKGDKAFWYGKPSPPGAGYGKGSYYNSLLQGKIWLRSSYELKFAQYLDKNNIPWLYEIQTFDLGNTTYTPDFYLPTCNMFIETKGYMRPEAQDKINRFLDNYNEETLQILYKEDLIKLGIKL